MLPTSASWPRCAKNRAAHARSAMQTGMAARAAAPGTRRFSNVEMFEPRGCVWNSAQHDDKEMGASSVRKYRETHLIPALLCQEGARPPLSGMGVWYGWRPRGANDGRRRVTEKRSDSNNDNCWHY